MLGSVDIRRSLRARMPARRPKQCVFSKSLKGYFVVGLLSVGPEQSQRYAASPLQGMILAATTPGADTDTLASVTGSILAAIRAGMAWAFWLVSSRRKFCVDFLRRNKDFQT